MYLDHFQLALKPFQITSDPKFLWLGEKHKEALATLRYGIMDNRGFLLLTGEVGTGKTLLINRLTALLDQGTIVATLPDPDLDGMDFFNVLADGFKMNRTFDSKGPFLVQLREFLHQSHANNKQVLLIIDECQRLKHHLLEDIRVLSNIELHDRKLINIFFVGQQEFNSYLASPVNRALAQRITVRYHIAPLEREEVSKYIFHRLRVAGGTRKIFTAAAIEQVYEFSGGIPRLINIICDHALLTAYARGAKQVEEQIISECAEELRIPITSQTGKESERAPDIKSIADAAARAGRAAQSSQPPPAPGERSNSGNPIRAFAAPVNPPGRPLVRMLLYVAVLSALTLAAGFAVTYFSTEEKAFWRTEGRPPRTHPAPDFPTAKIPKQAEKENPERSPRTSPHDPARNRTGAEPAEPSQPPGPVSGGAPSSDIRSEPQAAPPALGEIEPLPLIKEKMVIRFAFNSSEIEPQFLKLLDNLAVYLIAHPTQRIRLRGFTDSSGAVGYNESVSRFRTSVVRSYLVGRGVAHEQVQAFAMGNVQPVSPNDTPEGRNLNRRVEIEFEPIGQGP